MDIDDLIGLPFKINTRGPDSYDCYGLCQEVQWRRGFLLPDFETPESVKMRLAILNKITSENKFVERISKPEAYSIVVFDLRLLARIHVGVVLEDCRKFLHAMGFKRRVCINRLSQFPYHGRVWGYFRPICKINNREKCQIQM